jgi:hypothetical protein
VLGGQPDRPRSGRKTSYSVEVHVDKLVGGTAELVLAAVDEFERFVAVECGDESSHRFSSDENEDRIPERRVLPRRGACLRLTASRQLIPTGCMTETTSLG